MKSLQSVPKASKSQGKSRGNYERLEEDSDSELAQDGAVPRLRIKDRRPWTRCSPSYGSGVNTFFLSITLLLLVVAAAASSILTAFIIHNSDQRGTSRLQHTYRPLNGSASGRVTTADLFSSWTDCGKTPSEARARDCVFDLMLSTWIHRDCFDGEMMDQYLREGQHSYYSDINKTQPVSEEEARRGEYSTLWTDGEFHLRHCVYLIDMQLRSYKTGRPIEAAIYRHEHSQHCVDMALRHDREGKTTRIHALFGKCGFPKA